MTLKFWAFLAVAVLLIVAFLIFGLFAEGFIIALIVVLVGTAIAILGPPPHSVYIGAGIAVLGVAVFFLTGAGTLHGF